MIILFINAGITNENICACNGKMSPIISLKAEDKLELIGWKVKNIRKKMWYWDDVMCK